MRQQDVTDALEALPERYDARQDLRRVASKSRIDLNGSARSVHHIVFDQPGQHGDSFDDGLKGHSRSFTPFSPPRTPALCRHQGEPVEHEPLGPCCAHQDDDAACRSEG